MSSYRIWETVSNDLGSGPDQPIGEAADLDQAELLMARKITGYMSANPQYSFGFRETRLYTGAAEPSWKDGLSMVLKYWDWRDKTEYRYTVWAIRD